jgi:hypothetical protein
MQLRATYITSPAKYNNIFVKSKIMQIFVV